MSQTRIKNLEWLSKREKVIFSNLLKTQCSFCGRFATEEDIILTEIKPNAASTKTYKIVTGVNFIECRSKKFCRECYERETI